MKNSIEELHHDLLSLLKDIDAICKQNNIKYSLFAGTLIGAVRHKGFIPWDDDADIIFERKEYEKFIKVIPPEFKLFRNPWVPRFTKIDGDGIFIDIFVFDEISDKLSEQKNQILKLKFIQGMLKDKITTNKGLVGTTLSAVTFIIGKLFSTEQKVKWYDTIAQSQNTGKKQNIFSSLDQFKYIGYVLPNTIIKGYKLVDFEDTQLMIMEGYDQYLSTFYGDYMKLPTEDKRIPEHGNIKK